MMNNALEKYIHDVIDTEYIFENKYDDENDDAKRALKELFENLPALESKKLSFLLDLVLQNSISKVNRKNGLVVFISKILTITAETLDYKLCHCEKQFLIFNSKKWVDIDSQLLREFLKKAARKMGVSDFIATETGFVNKLQKQIEQDAYFETTLPKNISYINVENGIVRISRKGVSIIAHTPMLQLKHCHDFRYHLNKEYNKLESLNKIIPSLNVQKSLQQSIAQVLIKDYSNDKKICMYSMDSISLEIFIETIKGVLPQEVVTSYFESDLEIENMFINYKEIKKNPKLLENITIIPCDEMAVKKLNFSNCITESKAEILHWLVDGAKEIIKNRQVYIAKECESFKERFNTVKLFAEESGLTKTPKDSKSIVTTYENVLKQYESFCELHDEEPLGRGNFNKELKALGFESTRRESGNVWFAKFA